MAFDALTQKGSMGFNSGAPKQSVPMPVPIADIPAKPGAPVDPIYRVNEIGAPQPLGPITQD